MSKELTIEKALNIQFQQVVKWSKVLNADAYLMLLNEISKRNAEGYKSPSEVFRGTDIEIFIYNEIMDKL